MKRKENFCCLIICTFVSLYLQSCKFYRQDIMFKADKIDSANMFQVLSDAESNYTIRKHDRFELQLFANDAEIMLDPGQELGRMIGGGAMGVGGMTGNIGQQGGNQMMRPNYLVLANGISMLPLVGAIRLEGLTIGQADSMLALKYNKYYEKPFVITRVVSRRCIVFTGVAARVVMLENENTNLIEVLAIAGGLPQFSKADNIRLIRGSLDKPQIQFIDLTTIAGMKKAQLQIQPNDIVYVEPGRRTAIELVRDASVFFGLTSSVLTLVFLLTRLN